MKRDRIIVKCEIWGATELQDLPPLFKLKPHLLYRAALVSLIALNLQWNIPLCSEVPSTMRPHCVFVCHCHQLVQWPLCGRWASPATAMLSSLCCHPLKLEHHTVKDLHLQEFNLIQFWGFFVKIFSLLLDGGGSVFSVRYLFCCCVKKKISLKLTSSHFK